MSAIYCAACGSVQRDIEQVKKTHHCEFCGAEVALGDVDFHHTETQKRQNSVRRHRLMVVAHAPRTTSEWASWLAHIMLPHALAILFAGAFLTIGSVLIIILCAEHPNEWSDSFISHALITFIFSMPITCMTFAPSIKKHEELKKGSLLAAIAGGSVLALSSILFYAIFFGPLAQISCSLGDTAKWITVILMTLTISTLSGFLGGKLVPKIQPKARYTSS